VGFSANVRYIVIATALGPIMGGLIWVERGKLSRAVVRQARALIWEVHVIERGVHGLIAFPVSLCVDDAQTGIRHTVDSSSHD
jgi:hypothetical protein